MIRNPQNIFLEKALRVNHAGEYGALKIYDGQIAVLGKSEVGDEIRHMREQEEKHFEYFDQAINKRKIRPTALMPMWNILGTALGMGTALLGKKSAMTCTAAVETVIGEHYQEQIAILEKDYADEEDLKENIEVFCAEELEHKDIAIEHDAERGLGQEILSHAIKLGCKAAIAIAKKI